MTPEERILELAKFIYPQEGDRVYQRLMALVKDFKRRYPKLQYTDGREDRPGQFSERDAILITYGDQFQKEGEAPLQTQRRFLEDHLAGLVSGVHILPFFPSSSDDGFSVIDYRQVDPALGSWQDIRSLGSSFRLMFDMVLNHVSSQSDWFRRFIAGDPQVARDFILAAPDQDLSQVVRPRTLPLLTPVETSRGTLHVWTTFSADQIDLNYGSPHVLIEMVYLLLFYTAKGADIIRLDAIAYLWKEPGTSCIHLPQAHAVVKLFRAILDAAAPGIQLITETNVPHEENISYFGEALPGGSSTDEAQMVYAFPLAPLVLHSFHTGSAQVLSAWVASLQTPPPGATYFNFLASHDGIGVRPAEGLLTTGEILALVEKTLEHGGQVSFKNNPDGTQSPYELNITWFDALNDPRQPQPEIDARRFLASQAIMLSLAGVPGIYVHSLFGSHNCHACRRETGRDRSLNREKFNAADLETRLADPGSLPARVFSGYRRLLQVRRSRPAFHPGGAQTGIPGVPEEVFALLRRSPHGAHPVVILINVSGEASRLTIDLAAQNLPGGKWQDLLTGEEVAASGGLLEIELPAYGYLWVAPDEVAA